VPNLSVVAWPSETSMPYFDDQLWSKSGLMLRGSIRSGEGNIRVVVQLVDCRSGAYLWSETYDHPPGDMLSVQEGIAQAIAAKVQLTIEPKRTYGAGAVISTCARMNCQSGNS
jgi:TolB-like protein